MMTFRERIQRWQVWWISAALGAILGFIYRAFVGSWFDEKVTYDLSIMSFGFLFLVPFAMGYVAVIQYLRSTKAEEICVTEWFFLPWISVLITCVLTALVGWEGAICLIFAGPIMLISATIGGLAARGIWRRAHPKYPSTALAAALPLFILAIESQLPNPRQIRVVETDIMIHAPAQAVWDNIKSVSAIDEHELPASWINRVGFPKPVAATLSREGVGGVRKASFTGGLLFTETVNEWQPNDDLRFSIKANTDQIPKTTLDEHAKIGGEFFDVLDGEYRLEQRPDGVMLHLYSHERLSTHFNFYAGLWTDAVMRAIQNQILVVIKHRCEQNGYGPPLGGP